MNILDLIPVRKLCLLNKIKYFNSFSSRNDKMPKTWLIFSNVLSRVVLDKNTHVFSILSNQYLLLEALLPRLLPYGKLIELEKGLNFLLSSLLHLLCAPLLH